MPIARVHHTANRDREAAPTEQASSSQLDAVVELGAVSYLDVAHRHSTEAVKIVGGFTYAPCRKSIIGKLPPLGSWNPVDLPVTPSRKAPLASHNVTASAVDGRLVH